MPSASGPQAGVCLDMFPVHLLDFFASMVSDQVSHASDSEIHTFGVVKHSSRLPYTWTSPTVEPTTQLEAPKRNFPTTVHC
jgi:hypothetical protein